MKRLRMKNVCGLISGKHSWQRRGDCSWHSSLLPRAHHLPVVMADRQVLVQHVDDRRVGQRVLRDAQDVVADQEVVLEVDDVGLVRQQEVAEVARERLLVGRTAGRGSRSRVDVGVEEVLVGVVVHRA